MSSFLALEAPSIYEVDLDFFVQKGIKALLIDRDNTLDSYDSLSPRKEAFLLKEELRKRGIRMLVFSNNRGKKVEGYLQDLGVPYLIGSHKPIPHRTLKFLQKQGIQKDEVMIVGDQLLTDYRLARRCKVAILLVDPLTTKDHFVTRFYRWYDRMKRTKMRKRGCFRKAPLTLRKEELS